MVKKKMEGVLCHIMQKGTAGPVILLGMYPHRPDEIEHMEECLEEQLSKKDFLLIAYQVKDWNRDFSPWEAPAVFGQEAFEGKRKETLSWLTEQCIPYIKQYYKTDSSYFLAGYSLAGLFSLWAMYESDLFSGAACCSGSLWFEGWEQYAEKRKIRSKGNIYLSLGGKEEKTKNKIIATVGERTRKQEQFLKQDPNVEQTILEWNSGGHFADSGKRLTKGISWLLKK